MKLTPMRLGSINLLSMGLAMLALKKFGVLLMIAIGFGMFSTPALPHRSPGASSTSFIAIHGLLRIILAVLFIPRLDAWPALLLPIFFMP